MMRYKNIQLPEGLVIENWGKLSEQQRGYIWSAIYKAKGKSKIRSYIKTKAQFRALFKL